MVIRSIQLFLLLSLYVPLSIETVEAKKRVALVIGVDEYSNLPAGQQLKQAVNDAKKLRDALESLKDPFEVTLLTDANRKDCDAKVQLFLNQARNAECAMIYFAGHGIQYQGENFLLVSDTKIDQQAATVENLAGQSLHLDSLVKRLLSVEATVSLIVLDACRDNPFGSRGAVRSLSTRSGLSKVEASDGLLVSFSADADRPAHDGLFTQALVEELKTPGLEIMEVFAETREAVQLQSKRWNEEDRGKGLPSHQRRFVQSPAEYSKLTRAGLAFQFAPADEEAIRDAELKRLAEREKKHLLEIEELRAKNSAAAKAPDHENVQPKKPVRKRKKANPPQPKIRVGIKTGKPGFIFSPWVGADNRRALNVRGLQGEIIPCPDTGKRIKVPD